MVTKKAVKKAVKKSAPKKAAAKTEASTDKPEPTKTQKLAEKLKADLNGTNGHAMNDPDVEASRDELAALMTGFDNVGVSIDETQWRTLSEDEQRIARSWLAGRQGGTGSIVPVCLQPFASSALKAEIAVYQDEQKEIRRVLMSCQFGKPSPTKPDSDDEEMIKLTLTVPVHELSAATANDLWGWKRIRIEFCRRPVSEWKAGELPGTEQIITCITDISGFSRNRTHWKFSFLIAESLFGIVEAFDAWKNSGSCRIEPLGEPPKPERDEANGEFTGDDGEDEPAEVRTPSLFDDKTDTDATLTKYLVPVQEPNAYCVAYVAEKGGFFHISLDLEFEDVSCTALWCGKGERGVEDLVQTIRFHSLNAAFENAVGKLIDEAQEMGASKSLVDELKDYLNFVVKGGEPKVLPESSSDKNDPSF